MNNCPEGITLNGFIYTCRLHLAHPGPHQGMAAHLTGPFYWRDGRHISMPADVALGVFSLGRINELDTPPALTDHDKLFGDVFSSRRGRPSIDDMLDAARRLIVDMSEGLPDNPFTGSWKVVDDMGLPLDTQLFFSLFDDPLGELPVIASDEHKAWLEEAFKQLGAVEERFTKGDVMQHYDRLRDAQGFFQLDGFADAEPSPATPHPDGEGDAFSSSVTYEMMSGIPDVRVLIHPDAERGSILRLLWKLWDWVNHTDPHLLDELRHKWEDIEERRIASDKDMEDLFGGGAPDDIPS